VSAAKGRLSCCCTAAATVGAAADLVRNYTVVVPDLGGLGLCSKPQSGFDKKPQAGEARML